MAIDKFDDTCRGCRPAMMSVKTGQPLPDDAPEMVIVNRLWKETTLEERQAWHRMTCLNSRAVDDLRLSKAFADRVQAAFDAQRAS